MNSNLSISLVEALKSDMGNELKELSILYPNDMEFGEKIREKLNNNGTGFNLMTNDIELGSLMRKISNLI